MTKTPLSRRIDERIKDETVAVLGAMVLSVSDAFRMMMTLIAAKKALPFEQFVRNATTIAAMNEARRGGLPRVSSVRALFTDLKGRLRSSQTR